MGIIARTEATDRLKQIVDLLRDSLYACRDKRRWTDCFRAAFEAQELLDTLMPHLEEASIVELETATVMNPRQYPIPEQATKKEEPKTGGMGYRGGAGNRATSSAPPPPIVNRGSAPPPPIARPKVATEATEAELEAIRQSIRNSRPKATVTPRPAPPKPIVTPPPIPRKLAETKTFDLSRISGQEAWFHRSRADVTVDPTDWEMTDAFDRLTPEEKAKVIQKYNLTKQPVTLMEVL